MIKIANCTQIEISNLNFDIESIRTRNESLYTKDELFRTVDEKLLILCHTISEGGMGAYYCQQAIFENNEKQEMLLNLNNFWTPNWVNNFKYNSINCFYVTSATCYDKISKENPIPQILLNIEQHKFCLFNKDVEINFEEEINWKDWNNNIDICEIHRKQNAM